MTTKDSLQNNENPSGSHHLSEQTLMYFHLEATAIESSSEVCQIGAHFAEKSFSRYVCPIRKLTKTVAKRTGLSKKHGILYLGGERVETVSKLDAWKDFLTFLQSANNSVVLVTRNRDYTCSLLFRDLSELLLMEEFRKVCAGVIDTHSLHIEVFPRRRKTGKGYKLKELVEDKLGEENPSDGYNAIMNAINLEKLMKHVEVDPEIFQENFSLHNLEYQYQANRQARLLRKRFPLINFGLGKKVKSGKFYNGLVRSYVEGGEDGVAAFLSGRMKIRDPEDIREKTIAITLVLEKQLDGLELQGGHWQSSIRYVPPHLHKQGNKMTAKDSLQNNENPSGSHHLSEQTLVYFHLEATGFRSSSEVCQIGAHFAEKSFSRYVCPIGTFTKTSAKLTRLSKKDGILYLRGERVETVSKMDAWKDFLKFLHSANNSVVLVTDGKSNHCSLLFRDLSELSLMEEFRKVCAGIIHTHKRIKLFPGRRKTGKGYKLKELVQDKLGEENSSDGYNTAMNAINLEKLMKHAEVEPEILQEYLFSLSNLEYQYQTKRQAGLLRKKFPLINFGLPKKKAKSGKFYNGLVRSYVEGGEDGVAAFLSGRMRIRDPEEIRYTTSAITTVLIELVTF